MTLNTRWSPIWILTLTVLLVIPLAALADGFRNPPEGAAAIGAFGGYRAFADDANATIHNSANLVDFEQPVVQANALVGYGRNTFRAPGMSDSTEDPVFWLPGLSAVVPLEPGVTALGVAAYVPYGRLVNWGRDDFFAQNGIPYYGRMSVVDVTPNLAVRLTDALSAGIGADIYFGQVEQRAFVETPLGVLHSKLSASGQALGWNASVAWKVTGRQRLTGSVRSPFSIVYEGDNELSNGMQTLVSAKIKYPTIVGLGYGIELTEALRVGINAEWVEFSRYETLTIRDNRLGDTSYPQDLKDTWTAGFGVEWAFQPHWTLRAGFMHLQNPTPDRTYSPLSPDEDQEVVSIGLGYANDRVRLDAGYAYGIFDGRTVRDSQYSPPGRYDYDVHLVSLSGGLRF